MPTRGLLAVAVAAGVLLRCFYFGSNLASSSRIGRFLLLYAPVPIIFRSARHRACCKHLVWLLYLKLRSISLVGQVNFWIDALVISYKAQAVTGFAYLPPSTPLAAFLSSQLVLKAGGLNTNR